MFDRASSSSSTKGWLQEQLTLQEAVAQAPSPSGGDAVGARRGRSRQRRRRHRRRRDDSDPELLPAGGGRHAAGLVAAAVPARDRARVAAASRDITVKVSAWLGGQLLLGTIIGTTSAIGLWLLGIPFFYVLALISGIGELIPVVGPVLAAIPAMAVAATVSLKKVLLVLIFFVLQQQFENHVLVPKVMSAAGGRQRRDSDRRVTDRRQAPRHRRRHPRGADRGHPAGCGVRAARRAGRSGLSGRTGRAGSNSARIEQHANPGHDGGRDI